ncbi:hypothetical protein EYB25_001851 [Talaromyces marneffei]|uniref:Uncharacterized protein n=1 Tax=Talaromyces marneffei PM1 TaxID=1077442 RepID=A0A093VUF9_TALMA|nr:uncharacterized protein EYB26_000482 [Talaromyces marneffei]KAE8557145.1 hypothetical protein EYB25_001851 [Talaromyces marneffei]QGA12837.1 hypothetical protein EYB26_000482 [Talaromyces marneffei]
MATTPPPSDLRELREPRAPRHGAGYDSFDPYPTRQSARLAGQRSSEPHTTPPPPSPKKSARRNGIDALSPPGTLSPRKKTVRGKASLINETLDVETSDLSDGASGHRLSRSAILPGRSLLLPTPAKTPRHQKSVGNFGAAARSLFPNASSSSQTKSTKKPSGFSLDSFHEDSTSNNSSIEIFTDSRDRIPVANKRLDNPFLSKSEPKMSSDSEIPKAKRQRVASRHVAPEIDPKEAVKRTDGMLYTFRGKKVFRKFDYQRSDSEEDQNEEDELGFFAVRPDLLDSSVNLDAPRLTRSAIKGRRLFSALSDSKHSNSVDENEEATTDIEDPIDSIEGTDIVHSEGDLELTPNKRSLRTRTTRLHNSDKTEPIHTAVSETKKSDKRSSPFDIWARKKTQPAKVSVSKKREADPFTDSPAPAPKRTRAH